MKRTAKVVMLVLATFSITFCAFVSISAYQTRTDAAARLNEFRELGTSRNPTATFSSLRQKYGNKLQPIDGCTQQLCQYEMSLSNTRVSTLHIVPYTEMNVLFTVYNGSLLSAMLEYRAALKGPNSPVVHIDEGMCVHGCGVRFDVNPHGTTHEMWNGIVSFDTRATTEQRRAALAINLACLTRIGGCKDIVDLLPTVWTRKGRGTISSRLVGLSQHLEEAHEFPSSDDF